MINGQYPGNQLVAWVVAGRVGRCRILLGGRIRDDLDRASTQHPIAIIHVSGHLAVANSRALARAGISAETPDPAGGHIRRRPNSQIPNGVLEETALGGVRGYVTQVIKDPMINAAVQSR